MTGARTFTSHSGDSSWDVTAWAPDHDRILTDMVAAGMASTQMGKKLGRTKNAVIGRVRRLGLQLAGRPCAKKPGSKRERAKATPKPAVHNSATKPARGPRVAPPAPPSPALLVSAPEPLPPAARSTNLPPQPAVFSPVRTCQYPRGQRPHWDWCGAPTIEGGPYCAHHRAICWQVLPRMIRVADAA